MDEKVILSREEIKKLEEEIEELKWKKADIDTEIEEFRKEIEEIEKIRTCTECGERSVRVDKGNLCPECRAQKQIDRDNERRGI